MVRSSTLFLLVLILLSTLSLFLADADSAHVDAVLQGPSWQHWLGTDTLGRDLLLRVLAGARVTLVVGLLCSGLAFVFGVCYGAISGLVGGWKDQLMMRVMEVFSSLPQMVTIGLFVMVVEPKNSAVVGLWGGCKLALGIALSSWPIFARMTRNLILREKKLQYVEAAVAIGSSWRRIFVRQIFPNMLPSYLILIGLQLPNFLLFESFLSFFGLGLQAPTASWGVLLQEGWHTMTVYPHLLFVPAVFLFITILSINLVFDHWRIRLLGSSVMLGEISH